MNGHEAWELDQEMALLRGELTAASKANEKLRAALRRRTIGSHEGRVWCRECKGKWKMGHPEKHPATCLARPALVSEAPADPEKGGNA